jgi:hypothetical protein
MFSAMMCFSYHASSWHYPVLWVCLNTMFENLNLLKEEGSYLHLRAETDHFPKKTVLKNKDDRNVQNNSHIYINKSIISIKGHHLLQYTIFSRP